MAGASFNQSTFTGGEWSPYAQGRIDDKRYRTAMNVCLNAIPVEEGACVRRPGTAFMATTRAGLTAKLIPFDFSDLTPYTLELTVNHLRIFSGRNLVYDTIANVASISTDTPAVVTIAGTQPWINNDQVAFVIGPQIAASSASYLRNRQFQVIALNSSQFQLYDNVTGAAVPGSLIAFDSPLQIARVRDIVTPYNAGESPFVRKVQAANVGPNGADLAILLHQLHQPQVVSAVENKSAPQFTPFAMAPQNFTDGPYLDPPVGAVITPSAAANTFQAQINVSAWSSSTLYPINSFASFGGLAYQSLQMINVNNQPDVSPLFWVVVSPGAPVGPSGFVSTDVGRSMRFLSEPAAWLSGTSYNNGAFVKFNNTYYISQKSNNQNNEPDVNINQWLPTASPGVASWCWGTITAVNAPDNATVTLLGTTQALLYNAPILTWRMGTYSNTTGWPTCGAWYEGRLWLAGTMPNRFDASVSNSPFDFTPTGLDGAVGDANAITETFNSDDKNVIYWMEPTASGLLCGTKKGEWLIAASALKDPITPTSVQADRVTRVGGFNQIPARTPLTLVMISRYQRLLYEIFPDLFSGKLTAPNLNTYSKHLTSDISVPGVAEIAYQSDLSPIVWARTNANTLVGWSYRRVAAQSTVEPEIVGGHKHLFGGNQFPLSMCVNSTPDETSESVLMVVQNNTGGPCHVVQMTNILDPSTPLTQSWYVDDAVTPGGMAVTVVNGVSTGVVFYGLWHLNGTMASVVCGGLDCGDFLVTNGSLSVPFGSDPGGLFTLAYLQSLNSGAYGAFATRLDSIVIGTPGTNPGPATIAQLSFPQTPVTSISQTVIRPAFGSGTAVVPGPSGANPGLRLFNLSNFAQISAGTYAAITASGGGSVPDIASWDWTFDGRYVYCRVAGSNQSPWEKIDTNTWTVTAQWGVNNSSWSDGVTGFGAPRAMTTASANGVTYLVACVMNGGSTNSLVWMNANTFNGMTGAAYHPTDVSYGLVLASAGATVYALSTPQGAIITIPHSTLYNSSIGATGVPATFVAGTILPTQIDPLWGNFNGVSALVRDQNDGNLIVTFNTSSPGLSPNSTYVAKIAASNGAVIWKTPVVTGPPTGMELSRVVGGVMTWIGEVTIAGTRTVYVLNTTNGQINHYTINGVNVANGGQISDSLTGTMIAFSIYDPSTTGLQAPTPLPGTPSAFTNWGKIGLGNVNFGTTVQVSSVTIPCVIGYTYTTRGQIVRPATPVETGSQNGPAQGKTRRSQMFSVLLAAAIYGTLSFGTIFGKLRPANFKTPGGQPVPTNTLFSGIHWNTLEDGYDFDGMIAWEITRPLPANVVSIGGFIHTQDR